MAFYVVETDYGMGIREAKNIRQMKAMVLREEGSFHVKSIRRATDKDIFWVAGMGGYLPPGAMRKLEDIAQNDSIKKGFA